MSVQRTTELGPLSSYTPPYQCYCHFEASPSVARALAVPWQSDFADRANRVALTRNHLEHFASVIFTMFKALRMKS